MVSTCPESIHLFNQLNHLLSTLLREHVCVGTEMVVAIGRALPPQSILLDA